MVGITISMTNPPYDYRRFQSPKLKKKCASGKSLAVLQTMTSLAPSHSGFKAAAAEENLVNNRIVRSQEP